MKIVSYSEEALEMALEEIEDVIDGFIKKGAEFLKMIKSPDDILESFSEEGKNSIGFRLVTVRYIIRNINENLDSFNDRLK